MIRRKIFRLKLGKQTLLLGKRTLLMGVLNVTPDSFSDGGKFFRPQRAIEHALAMQRAGADIIDIGAESTRPGSAGTSSAEQLRRLQPVLQGLLGKLKIPISIDTRRATVAEMALRFGATLINDVSGLRHNPRIAELAARHRVPLILMHMRGEPRTMQETPFARDALREVTQGLRASIAKARRAGVPRSQIIIDPGFGFGKSFEQNYELLDRLPQLAKLGYPLLVGTSRKGFIGATLTQIKCPTTSAAKTRGSSFSVSPTERIWATAATVAASILRGAHVVRVHDVAEMLQVAAVADRLVIPRR
jgi:dihydropteroate synthase